MPFYSNFQLEWKFETQEPTHIKIHYCLENLKILKNGGHMTSCAIVQTSVYLPHLINVVQAVVLDIALK
jgi:hypothetical protein